MRSLILLRRLLYRSSIRSTRGSDGGSIRAEEDMTSPTATTAPPIIRVPVRSSSLVSLGYSPSHQVLEAERNSEPEREIGN